MGEPKTVDARLSAVCLRYYEDRTDKLPSRKVARGHGKKLLAFLGEGARIKVLTEEKQKQFVEHCLEKGHKLS